KKTPFLESPGQCGVASLMVVTSRPAVGFLWPAAGVVGRRCFSGEFPGLAAFLVFGPGQENIDRALAGIDGGDHPAEFVLGHCGAACGGAGAIAAPDMEEDGRTRVRN